MLHLTESVALLTKQIGISTPLVLSIVVCVARRLISYREEPLACIILKKIARSYCTRENCQIVSYMGFGVRKERKGNEAVQCICEVK